MKSFNKFILHLLFGVIIIFFGGLPIFAGNNSTSADLLITALFIIIMCAFVFYLFYTFLIPRLFFAKRLRLFWIITISFIVVFPFIWTYFFKIMRLLTANELLRGGEFLLSAFLYVVLFTMFGGFFRFMIEWFADYKKKQELEKQNVISELALLRSQINPFL